jgi:uncharacterized membrane protein YphA (DoxX/SURF4 family)
MPDFSIDSALQLITALGLLNVWLLRSSSATSYRGGNAQSLKEEFSAYGLPGAAFYVVGSLKVGAAIALLIGMWVPTLVQPAASLIAVLMVGAVSMHVKVGDPILKSVPALGMLALCAAMLWL